MRLYHWSNHYRLQYLIVLFLLIFTYGCKQSQIVRGNVSVELYADQNIKRLEIQSGSTVQEALNLADIKINALDRISPSLNFILTENTKIQVTRVKEEYYTRTELIPFEYRELRNEALGLGQRILSQAGVNGRKELTYQRVIEDGIEITNNVIKTSIIKVAIPEIVMIGSRSSFSSIDIPGKIAYLSLGNAWIIYGKTGNRQMVVSTGDLDGRIFSLSKDGNFLLFTRHSEAIDSINTLWIAVLKNNPVQVIDLRIKNVIQFADFNPQSNMIAYSTVTRKESSPGWQANNDLNLFEINSEGEIGQPRIIIEPNNGGIYGWWGTNYTWSPDGNFFLVSMPDRISVLDLSTKQLKTIQNFDSYQTGSDWAWLPSAIFSPDMKYIFTIYHDSSSELSQDGEAFNLASIPLDTNLSVQLVKNVGMFAAPTISPEIYATNVIYDTSGQPVNEKRYVIAYLQVGNANLNEENNYWLFTMDKDGSNKNKLFPKDSSKGLNPQKIVWSPEPLPGKETFDIALVYQGNLWILDPASNLAQQITSDESISKIDWR